MQQPAQPQASTHRKMLKEVPFTTGTVEGIPLTTGSFCSLPFPSALLHLHLDTFRKTVITHFYYYGFPESIQVKMLQTSLQYW